MSEYYQHLLVSNSKESCPECGSIAGFIQCLIEGRFIGEEFDLEFGKVEKGERRVRSILNPFTGDSVKALGPSRSYSKPIAISDARRISDVVGSTVEFDLSISANGIPPRRPLVVGYPHEDGWQPMDEPYYHQVLCRARSHLVGLSQLRSEEDLDKPLDPSELPERTFDEDCSSENSEGIFVHPELGVKRIPNAGCGIFWIEFNFGKFVYPQHLNGRIDVLDEDVLGLAKSNLDTDFIQACRWA